MNEKKETRDNIWLIPLIAGILVLLAILTPTAYFSYMGVTWNWWMWNFTMIDVTGYESVSLFISDGDIIIVSIITTCAILLSVVNLLILANTTQKRGLNTKDFELMSIISAVLSIGIMLYYMIAMDIALFDGVTIDGTPFSEGYRFWELFNPSFGIILPFISATLSFFGAGVFRYYSSRKEDIVPPQTDTVKEFVPVYKKTGTLNYCPECGEKLPRADANFCVKCGYKF